MRPSPRRGEPSHAHEVALRTTNAVESTFATVRLRQRVTKGPDCRAAEVAMALRLIEAPSADGDARTATDLVALVRAGATFTDGKLQERDDKEEDEHDAKSPEEHAA